MKYGFLLIFGLLTANFVFAQNLLDRPVDFECTDLAVPAALDELAKQTGIGVAYSPDFFENNAPYKQGKLAEISLFFKNEPIRGVLEAMLYGTEVGFKEVGGQVVLFQKNKPPPPLNFTVSGYVTDAESGERLIGASILDLDRRIGAVTNEFGFFSLRVPVGAARLRFSYLGFKEENRELVLTKSVRIRVGLKPGADLPTITVFSNNDSFSVSQVPSNLNPELPLNVAKNLPNLGGEADLGRLAMLLPGVSTGADGLGGLHVRGGDADHTQVLFDDVPVYYGTHALGMFTVFNPDVVLSAKLWKGDVPARYGGRIGSVLDVRTKDGNLNHSETELNLSFLSSRLSLQTPIIKQKMSLLLTGRHSNFAPAMRFFSKKDKRSKGHSGETIYRFLDINAKLNYEITPNDRLYISFYQGEDYLTDDEEQESILAGNKPGLAVRDLTYSWENRFFSFRWNHIWGDRTFSNTTITKSRFRYKNHYFFQQEVEAKPDSTLLLVYQELDYLSQVEDVSGRFDVDFFPNPKHHFRFGAMVSQRDFVPGFGERREFELLDTALQVFLLRPDTVGGFEGAFFAENKWTPGPRFLLNSGLRASFFKGENCFYPNIEPRLSASWRFAPGFLLKTSMAFSTQYLHVLRGWDVGTPADLWLPVTKNLRPQHGFQSEIGIEKSFAQQVSASLVGYLNQTRGLEEWKSSVLILGDRDALLGNNLDGKTSRGRGSSRGIEALVSGSSGGFSGWASYVWSSSQRQFDSLNLGETFPFRYDRRHQISVVFAQKLNSFADFTVALSFATGDAITNDTSESVLGQPSFLDLNIAYKIQTESLNNLRLPNYRRLDAGVNLVLPSRGRRQNRLSFGVYNVLNHLNARYAYRQPSGKRKILPGLGPVPYLNFSTKF